MSKNWGVEYSYSGCRLDVLGDVNGKVGCTNMPKVGVMGI